MIIPINLGSSSRHPNLPPGLAKISNDEFILVELQGSLEVECNDPSERDGKLVGKLTIDEATNKPTLLIGHHLLEGEIAALPKPIALLHRSKSDSNLADSADDGIMNSASTQKCTEWDIAAIVKQKIVFSKRPTPIVGRQS